VRFDPPKRHSCNQYPKQVTAATCEQIRRLIAFCGADPILAVQQLAFDGNALLQKRWRVSGQARSDRVSASRCGVVFPEQDRLREMLKCAMMLGYMETKSTSATLLCRPMLAVDYATISACTSSSRFFGASACCLCHGRECPGAGRHDLHGMRCPSGRDAPDRLDRQAGEARQFEDAVHA